MKTIAFFNNKGGVGKTMLVYHLAWMFSEMGQRVVVADFDPQANLTSMFLTEQKLEKLWNPDDAHNQSVMAALEPLIRGLGDVAKAPTHEITQNICLIPGDLNLSNFEAELSDAWGKCLDKKEPAFRTTSSLYRITLGAAKDFEANLILIDVGPNFGAINRAALIGTDAVVIPLAPDLFSMQGLRNLGPTLRNWREEWRERVKKNPASDLPLPMATMSPLGYVILQFGIRDSRPVKAYDRWARRIPLTFRENVLGESEVNPMSPDNDPNCLGQLKHYRSLIPMAMESRKPIFHLRPADGAIGAHTRSVRIAEVEFKELANNILQKLKAPEG